MLRLSIKINNNVIFTPSFICCSSFMVASVFLFILKDDWLVDFSGYTIFLILIGLVSMLLGERIVAKKLSLNLSSNYKMSFANVANFDMNTTVVCLIIIINFYSSYIYYQDVIRIIGSATKELSENNMSDYRNSVIFGGAKINKMTTQFYLISQATSYVFCFIILFNLSAGYHSKKHILYTIGIIPMLINIFLSGSRLYYITFATSLLWFYYFIKISNGVTLKSYKKFIAKYGTRMAAIGCGILIIFFSLRLAIGRANTEEMTFKEYIGEYIAAPSLNFEHYLKVTTTPDPFDFDIHRSESFLGIGHLISIFDKEKNKYNPLFGFRSGPHGEKFGNVYTAFARYYSDFGVIGVCILPFIIGYVLMKIMSTCLNNKNQEFNLNILFKMLTYAYLSGYLIIYAADDAVLRYFRHSTIEIIIMLYLLSKYTVKIKRKIL